jgi:transcriptional regulator with XRE-family HTH domain
MQNIKEIFAANLKENRRKKGLTQEKLAELADMSLHYLAMLELARKFPSGEMLERLAEALSIETHELFAVSPSPHDELERLRQNIVGEVEQLIVKTIQKTLAEECGNKK